MPATPIPLANSNLKAVYVDSVWNWPVAAGNGITFDMPDLESILILTGKVTASVITGTAAPNDIRGCEFTIDMSFKLSSNGTVLRVDNTTLPIAVTPSSSDGTFVPTLSVAQNGAGITLAMTGMTAASGTPKTVYQLKASYAPIT